MLLSDESKEIKSEYFPVTAPFEMDYENFSSLTKLFRVTATAMRFIQKLKKENLNNSSLSLEEIESAEQLWTLHIQKKNFKDVFQSFTRNQKNNLKTQLGVFIDSNGMLRCKGRLENAGLTEAARFSLLLPSKEKFTKMSIKRTHKQLLHSGVSHTLSQIRHRYWVPQGRATVRNVLNNCVVCRRLEGGPYKMPQIPSLPKERVTESTPLSRTGLEYFGGVSIKTSERLKKVWVCLFTCLVTRAVHLEMIQDLSANEFIMCLRRFIAQRGKPIEVISDNALQFKLARQTIDLLWQGIIKCDDVQSYASTENIRWSFIVEFAPWMGEFYESLVGLVKRSLRKAIGRKILTGVQFVTTLKEAEVGDVVLIKKDIPRGDWKMGLIISLHTSSDGEIRSAKLKSTSGRIVCRPLNLLFPVELLNKNVVPSDKERPTMECVTKQNRPERATATKAKLKIYKKTT
ncbi:uncharacterized protein LOC128549324 [Mercenaria mercenaria]|uniref:uncharacterized protein LOC128549324 n=1 Tax=Mercenaria mercenaria TaxID=6596 RepID=UPI00234ECAEF|nr:uncharacterized protein LOC128549324 [Mercenaria mercenaria]